MAARRSSTITCAGCGRCSPVSVRSSARCIGPGTCCSSICGSKREVAVGYSQTRKGYVVVGVLGYSLFGAGALVFSKEAPDVLWGMRRCVWRIGP